MTPHVYRQLDGSAIDLPVGKAVCVGRNYADHIREMASETPSQPLLFIKPSTAITALSPHIGIPIGRGECHNEIELAVLIKSPITRDTDIDFNQQVWGVGLALDLTLRDIQAQCKAKGHPWERAKAFDGSCPVSAFTPISEQDFTELAFTLSVNGQVRQHGMSKHMLFDIVSLLDNIRQQFSLLPGDLVLTGTPKGVGPLQPNDSLELTLHNHFIDTAKVVPWQ